MNEKKVTRKEWVKNAAIIFLTVMLILTFFSNTIMNYSLPEVSAKYANSGNITTKIRGTGNVESPDPYQVKFKGPKKVVESIEVIKGDLVQKGDVLCYLSGEESTELSEKRKAYESAKKAYDDAILRAENTQSIQNVGKTDVNNYKTQITLQKDVIAAAQAEVDKLDKVISDLNKQIAAIDLQLVISGQDANKTIVQADVDAAVAAWESAKSTLATVEADITAKEVEIAAETDPDALVLLQAELVSLQADKTAAQTLVNEKNMLKVNAETNLKKKTDAQNVITNITGQKSLIEANIAFYNSDKATKAEKVAEEEKKLTDLMALIDETRSLEDLKKALDDAKAEVDKLLAQSQGTEVIAPITGTITEINIHSGGEISEGEIPFKMQREGKGYTLSFSVTNEQAKRLSIGDVGEPVNYWRYDEMEFVISSIKPDPQNPSQSKLVTFDVTGEYLIPGQSITLSVGQKSSYYDAIVPNSAIKEDNNGKFVLVVESKSNAFVNRYIATRMDIEVIASDDTQSAVSGIYGYEYVITTSDRPIQVGQQVRLAEN